jgi:cytochrome c-type biogenesis protein CcmH
VAEVWLAGGVLSAMLLLGLAFAWYRTGRDAREAIERDRLNVTLYQEHLDELDAALAAGQVDEARHRQLKIELDRRLLAETDGSAADEARRAGAAPSWLMGLVLTAIPVFGFVVYGQLGASTELGAFELVAGLGEQPPGPERDAIVDRLVDKIESGIDEEQEGFRYLLANLYLEQGRADDAVAIFEEFVDRYPEDGQLLGQLVRARLDREGNMDAELRQLAERALELAPLQPALLGVLGMNSQRDGDHAAAVRYWSRLLNMVPPDSEFAMIVGQGIQRSRAQLAAAGEELPEATDARPAATPVRLDVDVRLAEGMRVRPEDTVFVYARAEAGPPLPLAVARINAADLPLRVRLDDSMAMTPELKLSNFERIRVVARVSRHGGVQARAGDLEGISEPLALPVESPVIEVVIDRMVADS